MNNGALAGLRVLDFSMFWAGPYAALLLAFMGAEAIKIESMKQVDHVRKMEARIASDPASLIRRPELAAEHIASSVERNVMFSDVNMNKMSIRLDLTHPKGVEIAKGLVQISDVVVENFSPGVMQRFGLDYSALKAIKPDIIMLSSSASGAVGPEREHVGFATIFNALSGMAHLTGYPDAPPTDIRDGTDLRVGVTGAFALLAALLHRQRTGEGQHIDLSSREAITCLVGDEVMDYTMNARVRTRQANHDDIMAPHNCYRCLGEDKWVSIAIGSEEEWRAFGQALGHPAWTQEEKFADAYHRWKHRDELDRLISEWTSQHTTYEVMHLLQEAGVAAVPSFTSEELIKDAHLRERGMYIELEHPVMGRREVVGPPWKLSATPARVTGAAPLMGQHTECVLSKLLGLSKEAIARLAEERVLY